VCLYLQEVRPEVLLKHVSGSRIRRPSYCREKVDKHTSDTDRHKHVLHTTRSRESQKNVMKGML